MSRFLAIFIENDNTGLAQQVASGLGLLDFDFVTGGPNEGATFLASKKTSPSYILIDVGHSTPDVFEQLDNLAQHCTVGTKVVVIGDVNDLGFYRELLKKGVVEYFNKPASADDIKLAFLAQSVSSSAISPTSEMQGKAISFICSSSGDGSTTVALNAAYALATKFKAPTVIVDMDFQFGLVARNLDLSYSLGIKDLYLQPEGTIDQTFIEKTIVPYKNNLSILPAPRELGIMPNIPAGSFVNIIQVLKKKYKYVIIDLPHLWTEWLAVVLNEVEKNVMVSQLNLKSVTHASRLLDAFENSGIPRAKTSILINRSGSKLKEPFTAAEFALATKHKVDYYISNESKIMAASEDKGEIAIELGSSLLNRQFDELALGLSK